MNILAVDTAGKTAGVALLQDDRLLYEAYLDGGMTHSETLMPMIDTCLKMCGMTCADIDLYGVNAGPGSFTGLRIGLAAVKGLAFPRETLCAPVSTLEALAAAHTGEGTVLCALDARRAQVYSAAFDLATHSRLLEDDARAVADLADFVENCKKPLFFVGDGASLCYNKYSDVPGVLQTPPALRGGRAAAVALVAKQMAAAGQAVLPEALLPDYHRLSQAERERAERLAAEAAAPQAQHDHHHQIAHGGSQRRRSHTGGTACVFGICQIRQHTHRQCRQSGGNEYRDHAGPCRQSHHRKLLVHSVSSSAYSLSNRLQALCLSSPMRFMLRTMARNSVSVSSCRSAATRPASAWTQLLAPVWDSTSPSSSIMR